MRLTLVFLAIFCAYFSAQAQLLGLRFNRLVGRDAQQLPTTNRGFGGVDFPLLGMGFGETVRLRKDLSDNRYFYFTAHLRLRWLHLRFQEDRLFLDRNIEGRNIYGLRDRDDRHYTKSTIIPVFWGSNLGFGYHWGLFFADLRLTAEFLRLGGSHRQRYTTADGKQHLDYQGFYNNGNFNVRMWQLGLGGRVGLGFVFLFADYHLTPFFDKTEPWQVNVLSFGLGIDLTRLPLYFSLRGKPKGTSLSRILLPSFFEGGSSNSSSIFDEKEPEEEDSDSDSDSPSNSKPGAKPWDKGGKPN